jgi:VCBS repeat-containing protein
MVRISRNSLGKVMESNKNRLRKVFRQMLVEGLERRELMAGDTGPRLVSIATNSGSILDPNATGVSANTLNQAPSELVFRFDGSQPIDFSSLSGIAIAREGNSDRSFITGPIVQVSPSSFSFGETQQVVIARFSQPLPNDLYRIQVFGAGSSSPVRDISGMPLLSTSGTQNTYLMNVATGVAVSANSSVVTDLVNTTVQSAKAAGVFAPGTSLDYVQQWKERLSGQTDLAGLSSANQPRSALSSPINVSQVRWTNPTGGNSPSEGDTATVSWSIVPDGTLFDTAIPGTNNSNLISFLDGIYGGGTGPVSSRPWFGIIKSAYDRWSEVSGLKFVYEPQDDGSPININGANRGVTGIRGDVRIGGRNIDGNFGTLAFNYLPTSGGNGSIDGDMVVDTADIFYNNTSNNSLNLFNVIMHEAGHGIGLGHVIPIDQTKLMEPIFSTAFRGPQNDDILAAQTLYGDAFELAGNAPVSLGFVQNQTQTLSGLSIDRNSDVDTFSFQAESAGRLSVRLTPIGSQYSVGPDGGTAVPVDTLRYKNLSFDLLNGAGTIIASAAATQAGEIEEIVRFAIPGGGTYSVRVQGTAGETQLYDLAITSSGFVVNGVSPEPPRLLSIAPNATQLLDPNVGNTPLSNVINESPNQLTFRFSGAQTLEVATLSGIRIVRSGGDGNFFNGNEVIVTPSFLNFGENDRIVVARFGTPLPDDMYRIEVLGVDFAGLPAVENIDGVALRPRVPGTDRDTYYMNLELGAKVLSVVPQPVVRQPNGSLVQQRNVIEVYFNDDDLSEASAENPAFYKLVLTKETANSTDDVVFQPSSVVYDDNADKATLTFASALDLLPSASDLPPGVNGSGTFRLRIGSNRSAIPVVPTVTPIGLDTGDTLSAASNLLGTLTGATSRIINEQIVASSSNALLLDFPGSNFEPGHRDIQDESHLRLGADVNAFTTKRYYSFLLTQPYGRDNLSRPITTAISEIQQQRVREVFEFYSAKLGIDFIETTGLTGPDGSPTIQVVVGDLLGLFVGSPNGPGQQVATNFLDVNGTPNLVILDGSESWDNDFGFGTRADPTVVPVVTELNRSVVLVGPAMNTPPDPNGPNFFIEAMKSIGMILGLGQSHDLPPGTIQASDPALGRFQNPVEQIFPGDHDVVHGEHLYRPDSRDVDIYRFTIPANERGTLVAEAFAERMADSSSLDTHLKLYKRNTVSGLVQVLSSNDDYFSSDSLIRMELVGEANTEFFIAVTASGNEDNDPRISGSGSGGRSDGRYQLRFDYLPQSGATLSDLSGTPLDGDGNGIAGGDFNYWFRVATPEPDGFASLGPNNPRTIFVDKDSTSTAPADGSLANPFRTIAAAVAAAQVATTDRLGDIIRVVGSAGADRNLVTTSDNLAYEIGDGGPGIGVLSDGRDLNVPKGVSLMIDAGAIFKFTSSHILVGSDDSSTDRGGASIQVLGTPTQSVFFTSYLDESLGRDTNPLRTTPQRGNWGGIEIRNDVARDQGRSDPEFAGIFLNHLSYADIRYGGGSVGQGTQSRVISPIHLNSARPTLFNNSISQSSDAGISADPSSFEETLFTDSRYQFATPFTPDYSRVGPVIQGNRITDSSVNGLFVRIDTLAGQQLETLDASARFDDTDIVYVLGENLIINGTPGGGVLETVRPNLASTQVNLGAGGSLPIGQAFQYRVVFVDRNGFEGLPSNPISAAATSAGQQTVDLTILPAATGSFVSRRIYRSNTSGLWDLVVELDRDTSSYRDLGRPALALNVALAAGNSAQLRDSARPPVTTFAPATRVTGGTLITQLTTRYQYWLAFVDAGGIETLASNPISEAYNPLLPGAANLLSLQLTGLPTESGAFVGRRLYRSNPASTTQFDLVATLPVGATSYLDTGTSTATGIALALPVTRVVGGTLLPQSTTRYQYRLTFVDANGNETLASNPILETYNPLLPAPADQLSVQLTGLPPIASGFVERRLYRSNPASLERWDYVTSLAVGSTTFTDTGSAVTTGIILPLVGSLTRPRLDASLVVDPGIVVKSQGSRIEVGMGAQLIAEGTSSKPIVFTSRLDDRYGAGATFDTNNDSTTSVASPGDWSGILALHLSTLSLDSNLVTYAGGGSRVPGGFATFNAIEVHQAQTRIVNSTIENNDSGTLTPSSTRRAARGVNDAAAIYISGSQPVIVNNIIRRNSAVNSTLISQSLQNGETAAISIDANSLNAVPLLDYGRSIGSNNPITTDIGNRGPLVSGNRLGGNAINGMRVRGATITTETVWDDTDIVHVVQKEIVIPDFHTYGGVRLQSKGDEGLVVKLSGINAGFTATGQPLEIATRIGGSLQVIGAPGFPVVLTSLADDTVGAGFDFAGRAMLDTNNNGTLTTAAPGDWRSIRLDAYANDRNVETTFEFESDPIGFEGTNDAPSNAQDLGTLAATIEAGDENVRLGVTLSGVIAKPSDLDVYRFTATAGSMIWFDIDRTSANLDTVVDLISANGTIIASSDNSLTESLGFLTGNGPYFESSIIGPNRVFPIDQGAFPKVNANAPLAQVDFQGVNPLDAGLRLVLPGTAGTTNPYFVRVRSSNALPTDTPASARAKLHDEGQEKNGLTSGAYRLQIRMKQMDEIGGSTLRFADIRYATIGIDTNGAPLHSPLLGEFSESNLEETNAAPASGIQLGEQAKSDRGGTSIAGKLASVGDIDWYRFSIIRDLSSELSSAKQQSVVFDIDYADGLGRADTSLWVFQADAAGNPTRLILVGRDSDITDDRSVPGSGSDAGDITRGSFGSGDAFVGAQELRAGNYVVAVTNNSLSASVLDQYIVANSTNPLVRLEPIDSVQRIAEDRFDGLSRAPLAPPKQVAFPVGAVGGTIPYSNAVPYTLADVTAFVVRDNPAGGAPRSQLLYGNAMTGAKEAQGGTRAGGGIFTGRVRDIAAAPDGRIVGPQFEPLTGIRNDASTDNFVGLSADGTTPTTGAAQVQTYEVVPGVGAAAPTVRQVRQGTVDQGIGMSFTAVTFADDGTDLTMFGVAQRGGGTNIFGQPDVVGLPFDEAIINRVGTTNTTIGISPNTGVARNILYRLDPDNQNAISPPGTGGNLGNRTGDQQATGTGTNVREYGIFADLQTYTRGANGTADVIIPRREAAGDIIGIVEVGNFIYGVTDEGELWRIQSTNYANGFGGGDLVATTLPQGMTGLSKGPRNVALPQTKTEYILDSSWRVTEGQFTLRVGTDETAPLQFNATAAEIQAALELLPSVGPGNVLVASGDPTSGSLSNSRISISFIRALAAPAPLPLLTIGTQNLTETTSPVATFFATGPASFRLRVPQAPIATGGTFTLNYGGTISPAFPFNVNGATIQTWLRGLPSVIASNAPAGSFVPTVFGALGNFNIVFTGTNTPDDILPFTLESSNLTATPFPIALGLSTQLNTSYSTLLFGITPNGTMHSFDINGVPQKIFPGGVSSTVTPDATTNGFLFDTLSTFGSFGSDVQGIDFSAIDVNLWHVSTQRNTDDGRGIVSNIDGSITATPVNAGGGLYFGFRDNNSTTGRQPGTWTGIYDLEADNAALDSTYNLPGGVRGAVESNPIDLSGYTSDDQPTMYFNYFAETQNSNSSLIDANISMLDSVRVYGYTPDGRWILLATNNSALNTTRGLINEFSLRQGEYDVPISGYQDRYGKSYRTNEIFDQGVNGVDTFRQARVNLAPLAGMRDARIRFEFSSSGDFRTGDIYRAGIELTAVSGDRIKSGDSFSLVTPLIPGSIVPPTVHTFIFDTDGSLTAANPTANNFILVQPNPPVAPSTVPVPLTAVEVRDRVRLALARVLNNNLAGEENTTPYPVYQNTVRVYGLQVQRSGPLHATINRGADKAGPYAFTGIGRDASGAEILGDVQGRKDFELAFRGSQNNAFEGVYIDDIIIGFAERGEHVVSSAPITEVGFDNTPFYELLGGPSGVRVTQTEVGNYQLEIRPGAEYGDSGDGFNLGLQRTFDTNERLSRQVAIIVSQTVGVADGDLFVLSDGITQATFEFDLDPEGTPNRVKPGNIAIPLSLPFSSSRGNSAVVARAIRDAINNQSILKIKASLRGQMTSTAGVELQRDDSNIVELFTEASLTAGSLLTIPLRPATPPVPGAPLVSSAPALENAFGPNPIDPFGQFPTFFPPVQIAGFYVSGKDLSFGPVPFGEDLGDSNIYRDQGQIVISSNSIRHSANFGIDVGVVPTLAASRTLVTLNTENLAPGIVIVNNILDQNRSGGISIAGGGVSGRGTPPSTIARVMNNTIFGGDNPNGIGILVTQNASPNLLNNILAGNNVGISSTGTTTVAGGNLFFNNGTDSTAVGSFDFSLLPTEPLFLNTTDGKFYPAFGSRAIDSSLGSLGERPGLTSVKSGIVRSPSSMIAPSRDVSGLLRSDDTTVSTPAGQGQNVFIDRGAVDRSDLRGPIAVLTNPLDDDAAGIDQDRNTISQPNSFVRLRPGTAPMSFFEILIDESLGIGPDPLSVLSSNILLTENGIVLRPGVDYEFGYSVNNRTIRFTPLSGFWRQDSVYEVTMNNRPRILVTAAAGSSLSDGNQLSLALPSGNAITLEYEAGFVLQVPQTSRLVIPAAGSNPGGVTDGQTFQISFNLTNVTFELDLDNRFTGPNVRVPVPANASAAAVRDAILSVLQSTAAGGLQLSPKAVGDSEIHLGTNANHLVALGTGATLGLTGDLAGIADGQTFKYRSGSNPEVTFEFNLTGTAFTLGNREIAILGTDTNEDIAAKIAAELQNVVVGPTPVQNIGRGLIHVGGEIVDTLDVAASLLQLIGTPGVAGKLQLTVPGGGSSFTDGQTFSIQTATTSVTFEFTTDAATVLGNRPISFAATDTAATMADRILVAITVSNLGFVPTLDVVNGTTVLLNESLDSGFQVGTSPLVVTGVAGGALPIPFIPSATFSADAVAGQIAKAINGLSDAQFPNIRAIGIGGNSLFVEGATSIIGIAATNMVVVSDFAGNPLRPNRPNGLTQFTIVMPDAGLDFGDAGGGLNAQTLISDNGARHAGYPIDVPALSLGLRVDYENDGFISPNADGDDLSGVLDPSSVVIDDEDGFNPSLSIFNAQSPAAVVSVMVTGIGYLDAWIDWNGNGNFDLNEVVISSQPVVSGANVFSIPTPSSAVPGSQLARFRLSSTGGLSATGMAVGGEVEDYRITIYPGNPPIANNDPAIAGGYSINEDSGDLVVSAPGILTNDTDLDAGQTATLTVFDSDTSTAGIQPLQGPANGMLLALNSNGSFTYRPNPNFAGVDTFTYYAVDSTGLRSVLPATVTINVVEVNDVPEFSLPLTSIQLDEDQTNSVGPVGQFSIANFATGVRPGPIGTTSEDTQTVTFNATVAPAQQSFFSIAPSISSSGLLSFKLAPDVNRLFANGANIPIVVTLSDNGAPIATSAPQTFTIDIVPVNDDPIANGNRLPNVFSTFEDSAITLTEASITANDSAGPLSAEDELTNQALTVVTFQATTSAGGTVNLLSTNSFNYRPAANFVGLDTFTYTISDGVPGSTPATATITINVNPVNDAPTFTIPVTTIDVLEDQGSTISSTGVQTQVPISFPGFAINVAPGPISAVDEQGQQVDFIVQALDTSFYLVQPTIVRDTVNPSRANLTFTLNPHLNRNTPIGSNNRITVSLQDRGPNNPAILPPDPNARPADVNVSTTQTFSINIIPVNDPPVPATLPSAFSATEDIVLSITRAQLLQPIGGSPALPGPLQATDESAQTFAITRIDGISSRGGTLSATLDGTGAIASILYRPSNNYVGPDFFTYTLTDNGGGTSDSTTVTVPINVAAVNDAPVFLSGGNVLVNEDSPAYSLPWATGVAVGPSSALDELNGNVSLGIEAQSMLPFTVSTTSPELFLIAPAINATGVLTFQLRPNVIGNAVVSVRANDSGSGVSPNVNQSNETFFTISINPVNDAPVFIPGGNVAVLEDAGPVSQSWATGILPAAGLGLSPQQSTDESNQTVSFIVTNNNSVLFDVPPAIDSNGRLTFITKLNANGSALVTAFARDTGSGIAPNVSDSPAVTFTITLTPVNDAPIGVDDRYSTNEDSQLISTANRDLLDNDFDPDGDSFVAIAGETVSTNGASVTINADGTFVYDPRNAFAIQALPNGQSLSDTFTYRLRDVNNAESQFTTVTVTVIGINDAPRTMDDSLPVVFNQTTILDVLANDIDIDSVINRQSLVIGLVPLNGRVTVLNDGTISYVPNTGYRGGDSFTYQVRDDLGAISRETTVQLLMNSAPVANPDSTSLVVGTVKTIDVVANDRDPDIGDTINRQSVVIVSQSPNGSAVVLANGNIEFTPNPGFTGSALVTYTVADNKGLRSNPGNLSIDVVSSLYQNPKNKFDVNNDGFVSPIDALIVINYLNTRPVPPLETTLPPNYLDVDGSGFVSAVDILQVINFLNDRVVSRSAEGEAGDISQLQSLATPSIDLPFSGTIDVEVLDQKSVQAYVQGQLVNSTTADKSRKALLAGSGTLDYLDFGDESIVSSVADELSTSGLRGNNVSVGSILDGVLDELGI